MKRVLFLLPAVSLVALLACEDNGPFGSDGNNDFDASESFSFERDATGKAQFRLEGINGTITVTGVSTGQTVTVRGEKRVEASSQSSANAGLERLDVEVTETATAVVARTIQPTVSDGRNYIVDYQITVPEKLAILINTVNGEVTIRDIEASTTIAMVNGVVNAEVDIEDDDVIDIASVNGTIDLRIPTDTSAELAASGVNVAISVVNLQLENEVRTPTSVTGTLGDGEGTIGITLVNGTITITGF